MTTKDIIALASAGFTVEQIALLNRVDANPAAMNTGALPMQAAPAPTLCTIGAASEQSIGPVTDPAPSPAPAQAADMGTGTETAFQQLLARMDAMAINASQQPPKPTTDDILAQIINPPTLANGKE